MGRLAVVIALPLGFMAAAVWWLESRFDAGVAITVIGALLGAGSLVVGFVLAMLANRRALVAAVSLHESAARSNAAQAGALREAVRWGGQIDAMHEKRVLLLADQRARLLTDGRAAAPAAVDEWDAGGYAAGGPDDWQAGAGAERGRPGRVVYVE